MEGMLDADVKAGRLTHEKARRLKEQVKKTEKKRRRVRLQHVEHFHATFFDSSSNSDAVDRDRDSVSCGVLLVVFDVKAGRLTHEKTRKPGDSKSR